MLGRIARTLCVQRSCGMVCDKCGSPFTIHSLSFSFASLAHIQCTHTHAPPLRHTQTCTLILRCSPKCQKVLPSSSAITVVNNGFYVISELWVCMWTSSSPSSLSTATTLLSSSHWVSNMVQPCHKWEMHQQRICVSECLCIPCQYVSNPVTLLLSSATSLTGVWRTQEVIRRTILEI